MTISFNPSELGMIFLGLWKDGPRYQINADDRLQEKIVIRGHLPFTLKGEDMYENELGVKVYIK